MARDGLVVDQAFSDEIADLKQRLVKDPHSLALFLPDGAPPKVGSTWKNPELARVLEQVAEKGAAGFYRGPAAEAIASEMKAHGGLVTLDDLHGYEAEMADAARLRVPRGARRRDAAAVVRRGHARDDRAHPRAVRSRSQGVALAGRAAPPVRGDAPGVRGAKRAPRRSRLRREPARRAPLARVGGRAAKDDRSRPCDPFVADPERRGHGQRPAHDEPLRGGRAGERRRADDDAELVLRERDHRRRHGDRAQQRDGRLRVGSRSRERLRARSGGAERDRTQEAHAVLDVTGRRRGERWKADPRGGGRRRASDHHRGVRGALERYRLRLRSGRRRGRAALSHPAPAGRGALREERPRAGAAR